MKDIIEDGLKETIAVLKNAKVGRIALSDSSKSYIVPLNFLYENGKIAFHSGLDGKKLDILSKNPSTYNITLLSRRQLLLRTYTIRINN